MNNIVGITKDGVSISIEHSSKCKRPMLCVEYDGQHTKVGEITNEELLITVVSNIFDSISVAD